MPRASYSPQPAIFPWICLPGLHQPLPHMQTPQSESALSMGPSEWSSQQRQNLLRHRQWHVSTHPSCQKPQDTVLNATALTPKAWKDLVKWAPSLQCRGEDTKGGGIQQPWFPMHNTSLRLSKEQPLNDRNPAHMLLSKGNNTDGSCGIINQGFAGVPVQRNSSYALSIYLRSHSVRPWLSHFDIAGELTAGCLGKRCCILFALYH